MGAGEVRIRRADPIADRDRILAVLARNLPAAASVERHDWLYLSNPCGPSLVWLAEDAATGKPVGTSAGHPKRVRVQGRTLLALNLGDFAIDRAYRTLGPALKLLRATLLATQQGEFAFSYEHPNDAMLAIYTRVGGHVLGPCERWVRLLRATPSLERRWGKRLGIRLLGRAGDALLRARDALSRNRHEVHVTLLEDECGRDFDRLDDAVAGDGLVRLVRSSEQLRWRYLLNTTARHEILCARRGGRLVGYLVFRPEGGEALVVVDLVTLDDASVKAALLDALISIGRSRGKSALWASVLAKSPSARVLASLGFHRRESSPGMVVYGPRLAPEVIETLQDPTRWWTLEGDQDV